MATPKKYVCAFCARAFTRLEHKQRHERSHTNEKPFHCLHCTSAFVRRDLLQRHCRTVHNIQMTSSHHPKSEKTKVSEPDPSVGHNIGAGANEPLTNDHEEVKHEDGHNGMNGNGVANDEINGDVNSSVSRENSKELTNNISPPAMDISHSNGMMSMNSDDSMPSPTNAINSSANLFLNIDAFDDQASKINLKDNNELVNLLSISKKLYHILVQFDTDIKKFNPEELDEIFLMGYIKLYNNEDYPIIKKLLKNLLQYLNSNFQDLNNFKICLVYSVLSIGFDQYNHKALAFEFFRKSWDLLILKLIPVNYNNNNLINQLEILNNLFLSCFLYLMLDFDQYQLQINSPTTSNGTPDVTGRSHLGNSATPVGTSPTSFPPLGSNTNNTSETLNADLMFNYLNDISFIIMSNLNNEKDNMNLANNNMNLFWSIYILLSNYFVNKEPPKFYQIFLDKLVINNQLLATVMVNLSKSIILIDNKSIKEIIIATLINELNSLINYNKLQIYDLKNSLHNSIILINKSLITLKLENEYFEIFKKKLIINCPIKFNDILNYYVFLPEQFFNYNLLMIALKEFNNSANTNGSFNFSMFVNSNLSSNYMKFSNELLLFFSNGSISNINNNLGIVSFPLIFNNNFLSANFNVLSTKTFNSVEKNKLNLLLIEWYLTITKILITLFRDNSLVNNYILQCLLYLLNNHHLDFKLNDVNWFINIFNALNIVFNNWMDFVGHQDHLISFKANLNTLINNLITSNLVENTANSINIPTPATNGLTDTKLSASSSSSNSSNNSNPGSSILPLSYTHNGVNTLPITNNPGNQMGSHFQYGQFSLGQTQAKQPQLNPSNIPISIGHPPSFNQSSGQATIFRQGIRSHSVSGSYAMPNSGSGSGPGSHPGSNPGSHSGSISGPSTNSAFSANGYKNYLPKPEKDRELMLPPILSPINKNNMIQPVAPNLQN